MVLFLAIKHDKSFQDMLKIMGVVIFLSIKQSDVIVVIWYSSKTLKIHKSFENGVIITKYTIIRKKIPIF